jgi:hypothetical protein
LLEPEREVRADESRPPGDQDLLHR